MAYRIGIDIHTKIKKQEVNTLKRVTLERIELKNFKGVAHLTRRFAADREVVEAKTGSGKSTVMFAWFWALGAEVPDVIPKFDNREVHRLETSVKVETRVDDLHYVFERIQTEQWKVNRDTEQEEKETNIGTYRIDGVDYAAKKYLARVAEIFGVSYDKLEMLCNKSYFNSDRGQKWAWRERRRELFAISNADSVVRGLADKECYKLISDDIRKGTTTADLRRAKKTALKGCENEKEQNVALLNERQGDLQRYGGYNFAELEVLKAELERQINELSVKAVKRSVADDELRIVESIDWMVEKRAQLEIADRNERVRINNEITRLKMQSEQIALKGKMLHEKKDALDNLTETLRENEAVQWSGETVCPTCNQPLPADRIQSARHAFYDGKAKEQAVIKADMEKLSAELANYKQEIETLRKDYAETEKERAAAEKEKSGLAPNPEIAELTAQITVLKIQLESLQTGGTVNSDQEQLDKLRAHFGEVNSKLVYRQLVADTKARIEYLNARNREITDTEIVLKAAIAQIDAYINEQVNLITTAINERFTGGISFSLFYEQYANAESEFKETCVCMLDGKVYTSLSTGESFIADLKVVEALQRAYGVSLPIFFDEAQSYTEPFTADSQIIELRSTPGAALNDCILFKKTEVN